MEKTYLEEGDRCPECGELMGYEKVKNCSCHINPPCAACYTNPLVCLSCGLDAEEWFYNTDQGDTGEWKQ